MSIVISLGWNCCPAVHSVAIGMRVRKNQGYLTCPFDESVTNYENVQECIREDFAYLTDSKYLQIIEAPFSVGGIVKHEKLIFNSKYKFIFNHESPGHANLFQIQKWSGGINHFVDNDFEELKIRYNRRVDNFRSYLKNNTSIHFVIIRRSQNVLSLQKMLQNLYPHIDFQFTVWPMDVGDVFFEQHLRIMGLSEESIGREMRGEL